MKLLCDACHRLLPPAAWTAADGALRLTCAGCGAIAVVGGATPAVAPPAPAGARPPVPAPAPAGESAPSAPWLDAEWAALEASWDDPEAHRRILARADAQDELPALGRRYKARLDAAPGDAAAARARDELLKRATAKLLVAPARPAGGARAKNVVSATVLLTAAGLLVVLLVQLVRTVGAP